MVNITRGIWFFGMSGWCFGLCDRTLAAFSDGILQATDLILLFTAALFAVCWAFLFPTR